MRTLSYSIVVTALTGCLISEPDGKPQYWPPQLGGTVEAVVAGDLDANGGTDIVVMMSGTESQAGYYVLESNTDLVWDSGDLVRSFSRFEPRDLGRPIAAYIDGGVTPRVFVATGSTFLTAHELSPTLGVVNLGVTEVPGGSTPWLRPVVFPGGMAHLAVSNGTRIEHLDPDYSESRLFPPPMGAQGWNLAQTVTSYADSGGARVAVVATPDQIYRATIPTTQGAQWVWEAVRVEGAQWLGQIPYDFDGDGRDEIIGFDVNAHDICVAKVDAASLPVTPSCVHLTSTFTGVDVTIIAGVNLNMTAGHDILVAQATGSETAYSLASDVEYAAGAFTAATTTTIPVAGPPRGRTVIGTPGPGRPYSVLTFGTDGTVVCALGPC